VPHTVLEGILGVLREADFLIQPACARCGETLSLADDHLIDAHTGVATVLHFRCRFDHWFFLAREQRAVPSFDQVRARMEWDDMRQSLRHRSAYARRVGDEALRQIDTLMKLLRDSGNS
jgi:hypothetical protein